MTRPRLPLLLLVTAQSIWAAYLYADEGLTIVHNGSVQGVLGAASGGVQAKTVARVALLRRESPSLVLVSCGNMLGPSVTSHLDGGRLMVSLMNRQGYDAMAVGPHDLFAGLEAFAARLREARFPFVCSNVRTADDGAVGFARVRPFVRLERDGRRIAVLGCIEPAAVQNWPQWPSSLTMLDPVESLGRLHARVADADVVIVLGTMTFEQGSAILEHLPWVDVVVAHPAAGATVPSGATFADQRLDGRYLVWSACHGSHLAVLEATFGTDHPNWTARPVALTPSLPDDSAAAAEIRTLETTAHRAEGETLATLSDDERQHYATTLLNALRVELNAEVACIHTGALRHQTVPTHVTRLALGSTFPFPDRAALIDVDGRTLAQLWRRRSERLINGAGLEIAGLVERTGRLLVNGRSLDENENYRVATTEFLALGGLSLLPSTPSAVRPASLVEIFAKHFAGHSDEQRRRRHAALAGRPVRRATTSLDASFSRLSFGGSASQYQYTAPDSLYTGSDIPGLVGQQNRQRSFSLHHRNVVDWPTADLTCELRLTYSTFAPGAQDLKMVDHGKLELIYEEQSPSRRPQVFGGFNLTGTIRNPQIAGREHPFFAKTLAGLVWTVSPSAKVFAGAGYLHRLSMPGDPDNVGLDMRWTWTHDLRTGAELSTNLDFFGSFDDDDIRILDWTTELRLAIVGHLTATARLTRFIWRDDVIGDAATRNEAFVGLGYTVPFRRF